MPSSGLDMVTATTDSAPPLSLHNNGPGNKQTGMGGEGTSGALSFIAELFGIETFKEMGNHSLQLYTH